MPICFTVVLKDEVPYRAFSFFCYHLTYLDYKSRQLGTKVNASTLDDNTVLIRPEYTDNVRVLREEMIHIDQNRAGLVNTADVVKLEIQAREIILANRELWGITNQEIQTIIAEIEYMKRTGSY